MACIAVGGFLRLLCLLAAAARARCMELSQPSGVAAAKSVEYEEWAGLPAEDPGDEDEAKLDNQRVRAAGLQIECPRYMVKRPVTEIARKLKAAEPVRATGTNFNRRLDQEVVFIIAHPYTGSTALLGLLATSPRTTTQCNVSKWACEGTWLLTNAGLLPKTREDRWNSQTPGNWEEAWKVYTKGWDMSQPVLLEKSPPNAVKMPRIAEAMDKIGYNASFIVMTRSPCNMNKRMYTEPDHARFDKFVDDMKHARERGLSRVLQIKYEDLIDDPWEVSQRIVDFVPQLGLINPAETGPELLNQVQAHNSTILWSRTNSLASYALSLGDAAPAPHSSVSEAWRDYMDVAGYL